MSKTVGALYDSRAEAEFARSRLVLKLKASSIRIIGKDTIGAIDGLEFDPKTAESYRERVAGGGYLLVAKVPSGTKPDRIVAVLEEAIGHTDPRGAPQWGDADRGVHVQMDREAPPPQAEARARNLVSETRQTEGEPAGAEPPSADLHDAPEQGRTRRTDEAGSASDARVRAFTHDVPAEEQVRLREEVLEVERRESGVRPPDDQLDGLFQDRVIEVVAMREEPVVTKVPVVHEEVIVRKRVRERMETIRDMVRVTEVEVEDVGAPDRSALFGKTRPG